MKKILEIPENLEPVEIFGVYNSRIKHLKKTFDVNIFYTELEISIDGKNDLNVEKTFNILKEIIEVIESGHLLDWNEFEYVISRCSGEEIPPKNDRSMKEVVNTTISGVKIFAKTQGQAKYIEDLRDNDIIFSIGPAGTGKTYLAVSMAVDYLKSGKVQRIILTRPAVEAGEKLGFLPGTLYDKVDPYLKPLYDSLLDFIDADKLIMFKEKGVIEIVPLAYMRGRTLNNAFIILDEAQNTTYQQMKMFLTRIGFNSKVVVTGDITQIDLDKKIDSGLLTVTKILKNINEIKFSNLTKDDVVRNPIVKEIIDAYEKYEIKIENEGKFQ